MALTDDQRRMLDRLRSASELGSIDRGRLESLRRFSGASPEDVRAVEDVLRRHPDPTKEK